MGFALIPKMPLKFSFDVKCLGHHIAVYAELLGWGNCFLIPFGLSIERPYLMMGLKLKS